ncbi:hypothetical protein [Neisseria elongata]|uniref:hypothetical protein n=1 Tax=Neisseria elongata TaxID=495 RepID=UPI00128B15B2|nr:hypothetical protein [Neisseria elongata]
MKYLVKEWCPNRAAGFNYRFKTARGIPRRCFISAYRPARRKTGCLKKKAQKIRRADGCGFRLKKSSAADTTRRDFFCKVFFALSQAIGTVEIY